MPSLVFMGVSGCGKSSAAKAVATALRLPMVEGDDYHPEANVQKMRNGSPLTDADRAGWLQALGEALEAHPKGCVLTCSALKRAYRDKLRSHCNGLLFVFMELTPEVALQRVAGRGNAHFFPASVVDSQFATLEVPTGEDGVLQVDATDPVDDICEKVRNWLKDRQAR